jgi:hypothetical protein
MPSAQPSGRADGGGGEGDSDASRVAGGKLTQPCSSAIPGHPTLLAKLVEAVLRQISIRGDIATIRNPEEAELGPERRMQVHSPRLVARR